jgi:TRAP-type C4-dicarboxylate transport system permease small subunit
MSNRWLSPFALIGALALLAMMLLTVLDVVCRYVLHAPLSGAGEATEILLALAVFAGLAPAALAGEHIRIDLLDPLIGPTGRLTQRVFGAVFAVAGCAFLAWRLWLRGAELAQYGDVSSHLGLPLAPLARFMAVCCATAAVAFALGAWRELRTKPQR